LPKHRPCCAHFLSASSCRWTFFNFCRNSSTHFIQVISKNPDGAVLGPEFRGRVMFFVRRAVGVRVACGAPIRIPASTLSCRRGNHSPAPPSARGRRRRARIPQRIAILLRNLCWYTIVGQAFSPGALYSRGDRRSRSRQLASLEKAIEASAWRANRFDLSGKERAQSWTGRLQKFKKKALFVVGDLKRPADSDRACFGRATP